MPPRNPLTTSFSVSEPNNEVVCPLRNADGTPCRKRCFGEKRYRSMQEHIRRAHADHYIPKLPATEESFFMMVNTPPDQRPQTQHSHSASNNSNQFNPSAFDPTGAANYYSSLANTSPTAPRSFHDYRRPSFIPAANAAAALTQLHNSRPPDGEWDADGEPFPDIDNSHNYFASPTGSQNVFSDSHTNLESITNLASVLGRHNSLASYQRARLNRPRKSSVAEDARKAKHERERSKDHKRLSADLNKRFSSEGAKRWEDLLDAAASATEEDSRDLTPIPQSPHGSIPGLHGPLHNQFQSYNTSPLQNTVMPQSPEQDNPYHAPQLEAFPSVEDSQFDPTAGRQQTYHHHHHHSSGESSASHAYGFSSHQAHPSGSNFHIAAEGLSSPQNDGNVLAETHVGDYSNSAYLNPGPTQQPASDPVQHYCAACNRLANLTASFACTNCICGICKECVDVLQTMHPDHGENRCPRCQMTGVKFKVFMLALR